jgi:hypothetical protein
MFFDAVIVAPTSIGGIFTEEELINSRSPLADVNFDW